MQDREEIYVMGFDPYDEKLGTKSCPFSLTLPEGWSQPNSIKIRMSNFELTFFSKIKKFFGFTDNLEYICDVKVVEDKN